MILPGMEPHVTRGGLGANRLYIEKYAASPDDFPTGQKRLWLPPRSVAESELPRALDKLQRTIYLQKQHGASKELIDRTQKGARLLGRAAITESGCLVGGLRHNQHLGKWLVQLAEWDWGAPSFDEEDNITKLRICRTEGCYNTRHYDLEFSRPTLRERKVELDTRNYSEQSDGTIVTLWGDTLPSIEDSLGEYIEFQKRNFPYVPYAESPLTPTSISQVRFVPETGCWEAWQYYCKPDDNFNWQFDGYGRLYQRYAEPDVDLQTGEITRAQRRGHWMAHRVIWKASDRELKPGRVLNHLCSYRRCCNPRHIEQVSPSVNARHGVRVQRARRAAGTRAAVSTDPHDRRYDTRAMRRVRAMHLKLTT